MSAAEKALAACIEYAAAKDEVRRLSDAIGAALGECFNDWTAKTADLGAQYQSHLAKAYAHEVGDSGFGEPSRIYLTEEEQAEVLAKCPHCKAAHDAIQARKAARKRSGIAKRRITMIGRSAA